MDSNIVTFLNNLALGTLAMLPFSSPPYPIHYCTAIELPWDQVTNGKKRGRKKLNFFFRSTLWEKVSNELLKIVFKNSPVGCRRRCS